MKMLSAASVTAQNGGMDAGNWTSLLVAGIALVGVVISNLWSDNRQKRQLEEARSDREKDQKAADIRREKDQAAAEKQRQEDIAHAEAVRQQERNDRERERLEEVDRAERERQRLAVAECLEKITTFAKRTQAIPLEELKNDQTEEAHHRARTMKAITLHEFYRDSTNALSILDLSLNDERVREAADELWNLIADYSDKLRKAHDESSEAWLSVGDETAALTSEILTGIRKLQLTARLLFLQYPDPVQVRASEDEHG